MNYNAPIVFLNINYPDLPIGEIKGIKYTTLGRREYKDSYRVISKSGNSTRLQMDGTIESQLLNGSDITELHNGYISITPLTLDCTDYEYLKAYNGIKTHE